MPKELGEGLREIADPELRSCLEALASRIAVTNGAPSLSERQALDLPIIKQGSKFIP